MVEFTRSREDAKMFDLERAAADVIDVAFRLHRDLGPGLLESVYETVLAGRLATMGYSVSRQHPVDIVFDGQRTYLRLCEQPLGCS